MKNSVTVRIILRSFAFLSLAVAVPVQGQDVDQSLLARLRERYRPSPLAFQFGLIGDQGYTAEQEAKLPNLMRALDREPLAFVVHDGDIKGGGTGITRCDDQLIRSRFDQLQALAHPVVYTPGDNEWTDCHTVVGGSYDPLERLAFIRQLAFANPSESLGRRKMQVTFQFEYPRFSLYRENVIWSMGEVVFVTIHAVGSNNNVGRTAQMDEEYVARNEANLYWLKMAFSLARDNNFRAVMIITQANPNFDLARTVAGRRGFNDMIFVLEQETIVFARPVVLVHGDSHYFRIDKPLIGSRSGVRLENFTRVETFGTIDVHWLRARVDPGNPNVFTFEQGIVAENLVSH